MNDVRGGFNVVIGHRIDRYGVVTSTNDLAWQAAADPANLGVVILAEEQTRGRGRRGDPWHSPAGSSLLLSIPLLPPAPLRRPLLLTLWASLGICRTIDQLYQLPVTWKWPNDVLVHGKKVCGTLVEQRGNTFVVGVGLNVTTPPPFFAGARLPQAAALAHFTTELVDREVVLTRLLAHWNDTYSELSRGNFDNLLADWRKYSGLEEQLVQLESGGRVHKGRLERLDFDAVVVRAGGVPLNLTPEAITRLVRTD